MISCVGIIMCDINAENPTNMCFGFAWLGNHQHIRTKSVESRQQSETCKGLLGLPCKGTDWYLLWQKESRTPIHWTTYIEILQTPLSYESGEVLPLLPLLPQLQEAMTRNCLALQWMPVAPLPHWTTSDCFRIYHTRHVDGPTSNVGPLVLEHHWGLQKQIWRSSKDASRQVHPNLRGQPLHRSWGQSHWLTFHQSCQTRQGGDFELGCPRSRWPQALLVALMDAYSAVRLSVYKLSITASDRLCK